MGLRQDLLQRGRVVLALVSLCLGICVCACAGEGQAPPGPDGATGCGPQSCTGCCSNNTCVEPPTPAACGAAGFPCVVCGPGESCVSGGCFPGNTCNPATCSTGCCQGDQCLPGAADVSCGTGGALCANCAASDGTCNPATKTCVGGQPCGPGTCSGCCQNNQCFGGTVNSHCGLNGAACVDCSQTGQSCNPASGTCQTQPPPPACGPTTCASGCCQNNQCIGGTADNACGTGGAGCLDCTSTGGTCDPTTKSCSGTPPTCGPGSCSGCCAGNQCMGGTSDGACGKGGVACVDCGSSGQTCNAAAGTCESPPPTCGPGNCSGCCSGTQCLGGTNDGACGSGGVPCVNCTASNKTCNAAGTCESPPPTCGPGNCPGCCDGTTCLSGLAKTDCGKGGVPCVYCSKAYQICSTGACAVDPNSKWELTVTEADLDPAKVWDPWLIGESEKPDPYFGIDWDTCSKWSIDSPCSGTESNTYYPKWYFTLGTFTASKIKTPWCAFVGEADGVASCSPPFETVGLCQVNVTDNDLESGSKTLWSCPNPDDSNNYVTYLNFTFSHVP